MSGGIRDPHILRGEDGKTFFMVATDMNTARNGWGSNPGTDEWRIVYHRINKNHIDRDKGPGTHREVCIDRLEFNDDGTIKPVVPTF